MASQPKPVLNSHENLPCCLIHSFIFDLLSLEALLLGVYKQIEDSLALFPLKLQNQFGPDQTSSQIYKELHTQCYTEIEHY